MIALVIGVVSGALVAGAAWGIYGPLPVRVEGFLVALAGGALLVAAILELIEPALSTTSIGWVIGAVLAGAVTFSGVDHLIDERWGAEGGGGLLAAVTLDGIPENLALGVALIGARPVDVAALSGSILLSNLPEAAGGARRMVDDDHSKTTVLGVWIGTAVLLSGAALVGNLALRSASPAVLAALQCFAAGAVVASLATEVFPTAFRQDNHFTGIATALGVIAAVFLVQLSG